MHSIPVNITLTLEELDRLVELLNQLRMNPDAAHIVERIEQQTQ